MSPDPEELSRRALGGDLDAWAWLMELYEAEVSRACAGKGPPDQVEELVRAAFVLLAEKALMGELSELSFPGLWIRQVGFLFMRKHEKARTRLRLLPHVQDVVEDWTRPKESRMRREVREVLAGLPEADRCMLEGFYLRDLSVAELAEEQGLSPGTIKNRLVAARRRFEKAWLS